MLPNCDNSAARSAAETRNALLFPAKICPIKSVSGREVLIAAPVDLNVEIPDLLPQRIAVKAKQVGSADLVAPRRRQRRGEQRHLDFLEDPVIEAGRRHAVGKT